jgi:hypothetical protein
MSIEVTILAISWILTIVMLIVFVPKQKFREAQVIFLFKQLITWPFGLTVVQLKLIEYPVREFSYAQRASFTFEFFIYPAICVVFNMLYPEGKSKIRQFMHFFYFCTAMTVFEVLCEKYTNVINYLHWNWSITWITLFITFFITRKYYLWFFGMKPKNDVTMILF